MPTETNLSAAPRLRDVVARQLGDVRAAIAPPATREQHSGFTFARGERVRSLVTGLEGVIIRAERRPCLAAAPRPFVV